MAKPIKFELEFSGYQTLHFTDDGAVIRPPTAAQMAQALTETLQRSIDECAELGPCKMKVTLKRIA